MINADINIISVLLASCVSIIFSSSWYGFLFGKFWLKAMDISRVDIKEKRINYALTVLLTIFMSYGVALFLSFSGAITLLDSFITVFLLWVCFVIPANIMAFLWSGKGKEILLLDLGNFFFTMQLSGIVVTLIG